MDGQGTVAALRARAEQVLRPLLHGYDRYALLDFPHYGNVGDSAIFLGELACLRELGLPAPRYVCDLASYDADMLAKTVGDGLILLGGGGFFGDLWPTGQQFREAVARRFEDNPIVQLPQSLHFERRQTLDRARRVLESHPSFTLLAREERSLSLARRELDLPVQLCPDLAFFLGPLPRPVAPRQDVVWLARTDKESASPSGRPEAVDGSVDWLEEPASGLRSLVDRLIGAVRRYPRSSFLRRLLTAFYEPMARERVDRGCRLLAQGRVVVSDRLHAHVLSLLLGIPHVMYDNSYGKISSFIETWTATSCRWLIPRRRPGDSRSGSCRTGRRTCLRVRTRGLEMDEGERLPVVAPPVERITYLIANYNRAPYLTDCLRSLERQTSDRWLAIVYDDGSTDDSLELLTSWKDHDRVRVLTGGVNRGYTSSLIALLEEARTDIVGILDADDALVPEATQRVLEAYSADPARAFVYSRFAVVRGSLSNRVAVGGHAIPPGKSALQVGGIGQLRTFRRRAYGATDGLDTRLPYAEDRDLVYKLEEVVPPIFIDAPLYLYRLLPDSQSHDAHKREVGAKNHYRARSAALRRRGVRGCKGAFWRLVFLCEYVDYSRRFPSAVKALAKIVRRLLARGERVVGGLAPELFEADDPSGSRLSGSPRPG